MLLLRRPCENPIAVELCEARLLRVAWRCGLCRGAQAESQSVANIRRGSWQAVTCVTRFCGERVTAVTLFPGSATPCCACPSACSLVFLRTDCRGRRRPLTIPCQCAPIQVSGPIVPCLLRGPTGRYPWFA